GHRPPLPCPIFTLQLFASFPFTPVVVGFTPSVLGRLVVLASLVGRRLVVLASLVGRRLVVLASLVGRRLVGTASLVCRLVVPPCRDKDAPEGNEGNQQRHAALRGKPRKERLHRTSIEALTPTNTPPAPVQRLKSRFPPACLHPETVAVAPTHLPPQGFTPIH